MQALKHFARIQTHAFSQDIFDGIQHFSECGGIGIFIGTVRNHHEGKAVQALKYTASILVMYICGLNFTISGFIDPYFLTAVTSLLFISMYNGERGMKMKYFFYIFYPGHLFIFYLVSLIL